MVATGSLAGSAWLVYRVVSAYRERQRPSQRLQRRAQRAAEGLGERLEDAREAFSHRLERRGRDGEAFMERSKREPGLVKKLLWMGLTAGLVALFGLIARRASARIWQSVMHEAPPIHRG